MTTVVSGQSIDSASALAAITVDLPPRPSREHHRDPEALARVHVDAACAGAPVAGVVAMTDAGVQADAVEVVERYCERCPVRIACAEVGRSGHEYGVWGGLVLRRGWLAPEGGRDRPAVEVPTIGAPTIGAPAVEATTPEVEPRGQRVQPVRRHSRSRRRRRADLVSPHEM